MATRALALLALAACGRVGFDAREDGATMQMGDTGGPADATNLPSGLVAWYPLDETFTGSSIVKDISGNHFDGTCGNCPTSIAGHAGGSALHFDGSTTFLVADAAGTALDFTADFTVAAWVMPNRVPPNTYDIFVSRSFGSGVLDTFAIDIDQTRRAEYYSHGNTSLYTTALLPLDAWTHLAIEWRPPQTTVIYINGGVAGTGTDLATLGWDTHQLLIGADVENGGSVAHYLLGNVDDVMLFDRALTDTEIADLASR
ncbi:MAG TPA: LamG domain-containing protein [Kofleriaceae bacterium]|nr:LamG domain-containing protein [Kofleriaceae bacterium]